MVRPQDRTHNDKLELIGKARKIVHLAISLSKQEGVIPRKSNKFLAEPFINVCRSFYENVEIANQFKLGSDNEGKFREEYQLKARADISRIYVAISINLDYIGENTRSAYNEMFEEVSSAQAMLTNWIKSDKRRLHAGECKEADVFQEIEKLAEQEAKASAGTKRETKASSAKLNLNLI